jgi:cyanophycin synthetase
MAVLTVDIGPLEERPSDEIAGFTDALVGLLPGLRDHHCSLGVPGGFVRRLRTGTYAAHVAEHVALDLANAAGIDIGFGRTRGTGRLGVYTIAVEYEPEHGTQEATRLALEGAVALVDRLAAGEHVGEADVAAVVTAVADARERAALGPSTAAIVAAARARGIPVERLDDANLIRFGWGVERRLLQATIAETTSHLGVELAGDKQRARELLAEAAVPVPDGISTRSVDEAVVAARRLGPPVVVKPRFGSKGRGVTVGCRTEDDVRHAFEVARRFDRDVVVEEQAAGEIYRVLVVAGRMVAASVRRPAQVIGDGVTDIATLVDVLNADPRRGVGHGRALTRIELDDDLRHHLAAGGRLLTDVPAAGEVVTLRSSANLSTGGTALDVTDDVHPDLRAMCERAARVIGLDICGLDVAVVDPTAPPSHGAWVLEANAAPGFRMHTSPSEGRARPAGEAVVDLLYPPPRTGRIPIVAITGTNGKTTVARWIAHALGASGRVVGVATTEGVEVDGRRVLAGDCSGPQSARAVLADPGVEVAVLETARGGIVRAGLAMDRCDVAVVTNVTADHLGQDGLRTVRDLVRVKAVVAGAVRRGGTIVANADDPGARAVVAEPRVRREGRHLVWCSLDPASPVVRAHRAAGGTAVVVEDGWIVVHEGDRRRPLVTVTDVPLAVGGLARFNVSNALAVVGALRALGVDDPHIAMALGAFDSRANPGRAEVYALDAGHLVVDYGHNPAAIAALGELARAWPGRRSAIVTAPGNRADDLVRATGLAAGEAFHRVLVHEPPGRRYDRGPGDVTALVARGAAEGGADVAGVASVVEAVERAVADLRPGDVLVACVEQRGVLDELLARIGARLVADPLESLRTGALARVRV